MVKFLRKKEKKEVFANGRIVLTDFGKLKKDDFPQSERCDMLFLHPDGRIYINSMDAANEIIIAVLKILAQYPKAELQKWKEEQKRRYPNIKTITDLKELEGDKEGFAKALSIFLVPVELKSREMQRAYYGIF